MAAVGPAGRRLTARRDRFFVWIAAAMLVVVALGFGRSFYARPLFTHRPLPLYLLVHGVIMSGWYLLFLAQAWLVYAGRRDLHRSLGVAGVVLATGVVITGIQVNLGFIPRMQSAGAITGPDELAGSMGFVIAGISGLLPFVMLIVLAVLWRQRPQLHKRMMYWAMAWTLGPAFTNTRPLGEVLDPLVAPYLPFFPADLFWLVALMAYDWRTLRRFHPATYVGFAALAFFFLVATGWFVGSSAVRGWLAAYLQTRG